MGKRDKRALKSFTELLIQHIFKVQYWYLEKERNEAGWRLEIVNFLSKMFNILSDSPSLKRYLESNYLDWYQDTAKKINESKTFLVPEHQPIPLEKILDEKFFG